MPCIKSKSNLDSDLTLCVKIAESNNEDSQKIVHVLEEQDAAIKTVVATTTDTTQIILPKSILWY